MPIPGGGRCGAVIGSLPSAFPLPDLDPNPLPDPLSSRSSVGFAFPALPAQKALGVPAPAVSDHPQPWGWMATDTTCSPRRNTCRSGLEWMAQGLVSRGKGLQIRV